VNAIIARTKEKGVVSGGNDGLVIVWRYAAGKLENQQQIDLTLKELKSLQPKARSVHENPQNGFVLVGTRGGEIIEFGGAKPAVLMRSHC